MRPAHRSVASEWSLRGAVSYRDAFCYIQANGHPVIYLMVHHSPNKRAIQQARLTVCCDLMKILLGQTFVILCFLDVSRHYPMPGLRIKINFHTGQHNFYLLFFASAIKHPYLCTSNSNMLHLSVKKK